MGYIEEQKTFQNTTVHIIYMNMYLGAVSKRESQVFSSRKVGGYTAEEIEKKLPLCPVI